MAGEDKFAELNELDLESFVEEVKSIWEQAGDAFEEKNYAGVVTNLLALAAKIGEVSPQLAPVIGAIIVSYGATTKPVFDQLIDLGTKVAAYTYESAATTIESLLPQMEKYSAVKAQIYAMRLKTLKTVDFSRREAMDILLAEISGSRSSKRSWEDFFKNINLKREEKRSRSPFD